jgi:tripartite-type tricarboxylate transporter receptor subunit TctC
MKQYMGKRWYFILFACYFFFVAGGWGEVFAQEKFPTRSIELIVATPPGGGNDISARLLSEVMSPALGQKIVISNKPGASQTVGTNETTKAKADGHTILILSNAPLTMAPYVLKVPYTLNDLSYIAWVNKGAIVISVNSDSPIKTAAELFDYAKKNPRKLTYGGDGIGNIGQFAGEKVFYQKGSTFRFVPYNGSGDVVKAILGGHIDVAGSSLMSIMPHIKSGKVRPLFVTTAQKVESLPNVPGTADLGLPDAATYVWRGILGPKGIPADRLAILEKAFQDACRSPKVKDFFEKQGDEAVGGTGNELEKMVRAEAKGNAVIAKQIGLSPQ